MFERLRKYRLRLNPVKCTFGVKSKKLLGFVVSQKGIEVDPDKVKAGLRFLGKVELHSEIHITVNRHLRASFEIIA